MAMYFAVVLDTTAPQYHHRQLYLPHLSPTQPDNFDFAGVHQYRLILRACAEFGLAKG